MSRLLRRSASAGFVTLIGLAAAPLQKVQFSDTRLDNGLRVIVAEDRAAPVFSIVVTYDVGSRNERNGRTGFAHLFEHMMFKGSENVGQNEHPYLMFIQDVLRARLFGRHLARGSEEDRRHEAGHVEESERRYAIDGPEAMGPAKLYLISRPGSVQTTLYVGTQSMRRTDPDYAALTVANRVLGGVMGRLFRHLREEKGYTYGIGSRFTATGYRGSWLSSTNVRTDVTEPALRDLLAEIAELRDTPVPENELADAKRAIVGSFAWISRARSRCSVTASTTGSITSPRITGTRIQRG